VLKCRILDQGDLEIMPIKPQGKVWVGVNDIRHNKNYHTAIIKRVIRGAKSYQVWVRPFRKKSFALISEKKRIWTRFACTKIPFMYSFSGNSAASAAISTFMCL
jgi:hypothetical protein